MADLPPSVPGVVPGVPDRVPAGLSPGQGGLTDGGRSKSPEEKDDTWKGLTLEEWLKRISYWPTPWIGGTDTPERRREELLARVLVREEKGLDER